MPSVLLTAEQIATFARQTIRDELQILAPLATRIPAYFPEMVTHIAERANKVVVSGMGKSGVIAQKMVATFNSVGVSASFLHGADALHGDLAILAQGDVLILLSKSGENPEIKAWLPLVKKKNQNKIVAIVGNVNSFMAKEADWVLDASVEREVCPLGLAPTTSAVAQLIWGDVLASTLMKCKGTTVEDFANAHPGGMLGKKILLTCGDLAQENVYITIREEDTVLSVLSAISKSRIGAVAVVNGNNQILGIVTDGDFRRSVEKHTTIATLKAKDIMTRTPISVSPQMLVEEALALIKSRNINQLVLADEKNGYAGMIHIHQILKAGFSE